ncbi:MAG: sugar ABC transporter permease [Oscillospiraceae bacterium]|nr:sugar ABC transporter permease [Oscillospiraceae bacterium]
MKKSKGFYSGIDRAQYVAMMLPMLAVYIIFTAYPVLGGFYYSITNWNGINPVYDIIGLQNFITLFKDPVVLIPLRNTCVYAFFVTIVQNIFALSLAIGLNTRIKSRNLLRTLIFIPVVLSPLIVGYIWSYIFTEPLTRLGGIIGWQTLHHNVLGNPRTSLLAGVVVSVWRSVGHTMIIYLAALQAISIEVNEAATVDGATGWRKFRYITFPLIAPGFTINIVLVMEGAFKQFDLMYGLTLGGPGNSSELISLTIYRESFEFYRAAYGTAMGVVLFFIICVLSYVGLVVLRRREENVV